MTSGIPKTMQAFVTQQGKTAQVQEIPVPEIDDNEVLVKTVAVAQNPTDWKCTSTIYVFANYPWLSDASVVITRLSGPGKISGCDWSGYVVKIGKRVTTLNVGDHIAGFVQGGTYEDRGAFAEYVKTSWDLAWKIPEGILTDEQAATMGCS